MTHHSLLKILHSARPSLWPAIFLNAFLVAFVTTHDFVPSMLLAISICLAASYGFLINDLWDIDVDRVNGVGRLSVAAPSILRYAKIIAMITLMISILLCAAISLRACQSIAAILIGLTLYTVLLRRHLAIANLLAAFLGATPLWLPFIVFSIQPTRFQMGVVVAAIVILFGREIALDVKDYRGDLASGRNTFATVFGGLIASRLSVIIELTGCAIVLAVSGNFVNDTTNFFTRAVVAMVAIGIVSLLGYGALKIWKYDPTVSPAMKLFIKCSRVAMLFVPVLVYIASR